MLMSSVVVNLVCVHGKGEKGRWGPGKGAKNRAVDSEHRTSRGRSLLPRRKSHHSK